MSIIDDTAGIARRLREIKGERPKHDGPCPKCEDCGWQCVDDQWSVGKLMRWTPCTMCGNPEKRGKPGVGLDWYTSADGAHMSRRNPAEARKMKGAIVAMAEVLWPLCDLYNRTALAAWVYDNLS
jgi:hypothetical protein